MCSCPVHLIPNQCNHLLIWDSSGLYGRGVNEREIYWDSSKCFLIASYGQLKCYCCNWSAESAEAMFLLVFLVVTKQLQVHYWTLWPKKKRANLMRYNQICDPANGEAYSKCKWKWIKSHYRAPSRWTVTTCATYPQHLRLISGLGLVLRVITISLFVSSAFSLLTNPVKVKKKASVFWPDTKQSWQL